MGKTVLELITPLICPSCFDRIEDDTINFINHVFVMATNLRQFVFML